MMENVNKNTPHSGHFHFVWHEWPCLNWRARMWNFSMIINLNCQKNPNKTREMDKKYCFTVGQDIWMSPVPMLCSLLSRLLLAAQRSRKLIKVNCDTVTMTRKLTESEGRRSCSDAGRDVINGCGIRCTVFWKAGHVTWISSLCSLNWPVCVCTHETKLNETWKELINAKKNQKITFQKILLLFFELFYNAVSNATQDIIIERGWSDWGRQQKAFSVKIL
jgi:hypothetical protein